MHRHPILTACLFLTSSLVVAAPPADAQIINRYMFRGLERSDIDTLRPLIRDALGNDAAGATRPWHSPSGKSGFIQLMEGGAKAGLNTGTMKITLVRADRTTTSYVFRYQQDTKGVWRSVG